MLCRLRAFRRGIRNLFFWRKTIWQDADWDYEYLLNIFQKKMEKMETYFNSNQSFVAKEEAQLVAEQLREAINSVEYLRGAQYEEDAFRAYWTKYPIDENFFTRLSMGLVEATEFEEAKAESERLYDEAFDKLSLNLKKNMLSWWD